MSTEVERLTKRLAKLSPSELLSVHREVCRLASPIYAKVYRSAWEAGVAASRDKQKRGYDAFRPLQSAMWARIRGDEAPRPVEPYGDDTASGEILTASPGKSSRRP